MNKLTCALFAWFMSGFVTSAFAQDTQVAMADRMREDGKIYVVVTVCMIILTGLILYLVSLDRRIRKMENNNND